MLCSSRLWVAAISKDIWKKKKTHTKKDGEEEGRTEEVI